MGAWRGGGGGGEEGGSGDTGSAEPDMSEGTGCTRRAERVQGAQRRGGVEAVMGVALLRGLSPAQSSVRFRLRAVL